MSLGTRFRLLARLAGDAQRLGYDALAEPFGGSLPLSPTALGKPGPLNRLLDSDGVGAGATARVSSVDLLDIKSISSNCNNVVARIEVAEGELPPSVFIKLPSENLWTRLFCNLLGIWSNECHFYRNAASRVPFRVPEPYVVADRGSRFVLVLEDLHMVSGVRLFTNPDMIQGVGVERATACLSAFASLHASFHGLTPEERATILPPQLHPFASPIARALSPVLSRAAIKPCHRKAPDVFTKGMVALYERALDRYDALLEYWFAEPLTLIHGDSHLGNFFVAGEEMGMLDWQAVQWAKGIRDVQYFLINSMREDDLAQHERSLLAHYVEELGRLGIALSEDDAWAQYRAYAFQTLMTSVVSLGLATMTDMDEVLDVLLRRSIGAIRRTGFAGWLEEL